MDRRGFIKNTALCTGALCMGCLNAQAAINIPKKVIIESCTLCQLSCVKCWRSCTPNQIPLGYLRFEDFKTFVDNNHFIEEIGIAQNGEIFLNPDLNKIINYAYSKKVKLSADSGVNLNYISDETAELLVSRKFEELTISIDGASQETYSIYRRGGNFNNVIDNIKKIQYYQKKYNDFEHPKMVWKFIVFGHNEHEIPKAKQMAKELGIPIRFDVNYAKDYSPVKNIDFVKKETGLDFNPIYKQENLDSNAAFYEMFYNRYINQKDWNWFYCTAFYDEPNIFFDGTFLGCCLGITKPHSNLNVFKTDFLNVLKNREIQNTEKVFELKTNAAGSMCENCDVLKFLKENNIKISKEKHEKIKKRKTSKI